MKIVGFVFTFLISFSLVGSQATFEKHDASRDWPAVEEIIKDNASYLAYESLSFPEGTTKKYIESKKYITTVARMNDKTVGFVNYTVSNVSFLTFHIARPGIIHLLGVAAGYQKKGIGRTLLESACKDLETQKAQYISLFVNVDNDDARALYEKCGFKNLYEAVVKDERSLLTVKQLLDKVGYPFQLQYRKETNTPANKLPQGNIIQRNPKTSLALVSVAVAAYYGFKS